MLFSPFSHTQRTIVVIPDTEVKRILNHARIILKDGPVAVEGRIIGWKRTHAGPLGAVVVNPLTGARFLWGVDFANGRARSLKRLL